MRWAIFDGYGMDLPEWDQWDAEGLNLLAPWFSNDHFFRALFTPHNEHRVVLTKLLNLSLTLANGQWDQRLEVVVNALLPAGLAVILFQLARRHLAAFTLAPLWIFLAICFGLPFAWENMLAGFHSQQFFLVVLALGTIALLPFSRPGSLRWWLGVACAILGFFSMGSGFFAAVVVIVVIGVLLLHRETTLRAALPTLILCLALSVIGWVTRHEVGQHIPLRAKTVSEFLLTIVRSLQWPAPLSEWFALVLWLPWTWLTLRLLRQAQTTPLPQRMFGYFIVGLGSWVWLQFLATAYARGAGAPPPASRYLDTVLLGLIANALSLAWLATPGLLTKSARQGLLGVTLAWVSLFTWGGFLEVRERLIVALPPTKNYHDYSKQNVRNFLLTGDPKHLDHDEIPYPGASILINRLELPGIIPVLPVSVRPPLPLAPAQSNFLSSKTSSMPGRNGLAPAVPPLDYRLSWGSYSDLPVESGIREFISVPLRVKLGGWLRFETVGHVGEPGVVLELRDARTGASLGAIASDKIPGNAWRGAFVPAPSGSFVVYARVPDAAHWIGFSQPIEMARGSFWAWQISKHGFLVAEIALGAAALLGLAVLVLNRRQATA